MRKVAGEHVIPGELNPADPQRVLDEAMAAGHEGLIVKALDSPYAAGRRGRAWLKVKPVPHTIDLVVLGRPGGARRRMGPRQAHRHPVQTAPRRPRPRLRPAPIMVGKTFKGMTDELLAWQTTRFQEIETSRDDWVVYVRPELVVEIELDGAQASTRYPGGVALRFGRVVRYRPDKDPADTIDTIRSLRKGG